MKMCIQKRAVSFSSSIGRDTRHAVGTVAKSPNAALYGIETDTEGRGKVAELLRLLEEDGWRLARTRSSHRQHKHSRKRGMVTMAGTASLDVPPGTLNSILKQAGPRREK